MENKSLLDWHSMFMGVALLAAARSKDARKRNGACIASSDYKILGVGYNGLPRGCDDDDPTYWADDDFSAETGPAVTQAKRNASPARPKLFRSS